MQSRLKTLFWQRSGVGTVNRERRQPTSKLEIDCLLGENLGEHSGPVGTYTPIHEVDQQKSDQKSDLLRDRADLLKLMVRLLRQSGGNKSGLRLVLRVDSPVLKGRVHRISTKAYNLANLTTVKRLSFFCPEVPS